MKEAKTAWRQGIKSWRRDIEDFNETAEDFNVLLKRVIKNVAYDHEMDTTFMAKPYYDQAGNGHTSANRLFWKGTIREMA